MTFIRRAAVATGTAALLALTLSGCGDDDSKDDDKKSSDAPAAASEEDFCEAFNAVFGDLAAIQTQPTEDQWTELQAKVETLDEVGPPEDISDDNREGFDVLVRAVTETEYDESLDFTGEIPGATADEQAKATGFVQYAATLCVEAIPTE